MSENSYKPTGNQTKNIKNYIRDYLQARANVIITRCRTKITDIANKILTITGDMTGTADLSSPNDDNVVIINVKVADDNHKHSDNVGTINPVPNEIVKRDKSGRIYGIGEYYNNTGFLLANGADISSLFVNKNDPEVDSNTTNTGSGSGCYLEKLQLKVNTSTNTVTLERELSNYCQIYPHSTYDVEHYSK